MDDPDASGPRRSGQLMAIGIATASKESKPVGTVQTSRSTVQKNSMSNPLGSKRTQKPTSKTS